MTQKHKTHDAGRSCVGVQQTLLPGFRVSRRRVTLAFAVRKLDVEPLDGPVAHNWPLVLRCWEHDQTATFGPRPKSAVAPEVGHTTLAQLKESSSGEIRRWSVVALEASSRSAPFLKSLVRMTAPSCMLRSRMSSNNAMQTDLRLAHSFLMWTLATVKWEHDGSDALRNLPVTIMPSTAHEEHLGEQTTWMGVHGKSRVKVSLLRARRNGAG